MCYTWDPSLPPSLTPAMEPHTTVLLAPLDATQRAQRLAEPRAGAGTYTTAGCEHLLLV